MVGDAANSALVAINASTDFHADGADRWVATERYVRGEIVDMGGKIKANVHIVLENGEMMSVAADKVLLAQLEGNKLYKRALLRIQARYNIVTREVRDVRLLEFVEYEPRFTEADKQRLTERGAQAWKDVPDASAWVESIRGND